MSGRSARYAIVAGILLIALLLNVAAAVTSGGWLRWAAVALIALALVFSVVQWWRTPSSQ